MHKLPYFLLSALMAFGAAELRADEVTLTTDLATGESLALALNADLSVTLTWGNGDEETLSGTGAVTNVTVKDASLTITSTIGKITALYLQGNQISALDVSDAPYLQQLLCAENNLTSLSLTGNEELVDLDVQDNELSSITLSKCSAIKGINVARNELSKLSLSTSARPTSLVCSENSLSALPASGLLAKAQTIWAGHNELTSVTLTSSKDLRCLSLPSNSLTTLNLAAAELLHDVWVENNSLTTLDLSKGSPILYALSADNNELTTLTWDTDCKKTCDYAYVNDNALFINSLPSLTYNSREINAVVLPQEDYVIEDYYDVDETINLYDLTTKNGWGVAQSPTIEVVDASGNTLTSGTDYTISSRKVTFGSEYENLHFEVVGKSYSGTTFVTTAFNVGVESTGISQATVSGEGLSWVTSKGRLDISASSATDLRIYSTSGVCVVNEKLGTESRSFTLPKGVYLVNGKKILVP